MGKLLKCKKLYFFILTALVLTAVYFNTERSSTIQPVAEQGDMDLSGWNMEQDGIFSLDGEWEFYWDKLLTYEDFHHGEVNLSPDGYVPVPGVWNSYEVNGEALPGEGFATFRLRIKNSDLNQEMGLKISNMSTAYNLFVNNNLIASNGIVSNRAKDGKAEYRPQAVTFKPPSDDFEIIIQVSNYTYARGGVWYSIYMGTSQQIQAMKENASRREMFIFGGIVMMMIYHLAIYIFQRKNISILYYVLMMLIIAARIPVTGEYMISEVSQGADIRPQVIVEYLTICWAPITWLLFINRFYPEEISKKVVRASVYAGGILSVFTLLTPVKIFTSALLVYELIVVAFFIYALQRFIAAKLKKREGVTLMLFATAAFFGTFVNDALYQWNIISSRSGGIFGFSAFVIIFIQAYVLAAQFSKSYREVEDLSDRLLSLDRLKDEFLANTSHELRTPLNGIINITDSILENSDGMLGDAQKQNLRIVSSAARRLYNLINDILDISIMKNSEVRLNKRPVDLHSVADLTLYVLSQSKGEKDIEFINAIPEDMPPVQADVDRLRQIFYNLLGNALKFTEQGRIETGASAKSDHAEIWIKDTGCGIPEDKLEEIFKPFYQGDSTEIRPAGGTGLGLPITKSLIELHGGSIQAHSLLGQGTCFSFTLPLSKEQRQDIHMEPMIRTFDETSAMKGITGFQEKGNRKYSILVADDDPANLAALFNILSLEGYHVKVATRGEDVLRELETQCLYDLIILDVMMPQMSGYEILKKIRQRFQPIDIPVLLLTARARPEDLRTGFEAGANDYLAKPFEALELKARVKTLIQLKESVNRLIEGELSFLQAQIKPHFLYNALSVIASLSTREPERAKGLLYDLSDYLRGSFNFENNSGVTPLSRELATVKAYISIEKERFRGKLNVKYDIDETIEAMVPLLAIQPLVENGIRHGILKKPEGGTLSLRIKREGSDVVIEVQDDGVGFTREQLAEILQGEAPGSGVGLKNIHRRMILYYGNGLNISSEEGKGTAVVLRIPAL